MVDVSGGMRFPQSRESIGCWPSHGPSGIRLWYWEHGDVEPSRMIRLARQEIFELPWKESFPGRLRRWFLPLSTGHPKGDSWDHFGMCLAQLFESSSGSVGRMLPGTSNWREQITTGCTGDLTRHPGFPRDGRLRVAARFMQQTLPASRKVFRNPAAWSERSLLLLRWLLGRIRQTLSSRSRQRPECPV